MISVPLYFKVDQPKFERDGVSDKIDGDFCMKLLDRDAEFQKIEQIPRSLKLMKRRELLMKNKNMLVVTKKERESRDMNREDSEVKKYRERFGHYTISALKK